MATPKWSSTVTVALFSHEVVKRTAINACIISWLRMSGNFPGSQWLRLYANAGGVRLISGHQGTNSGTTTPTPPPPHAKKEYVVIHVKLLLVMTGSKSYFYIIVTKK